MNGGRAGARAMCVSLTAERVTDGSVEDAQAMVDKVICNGEGALFKHGVIEEDLSEVEQTAEDLDVEQNQDNGDEQEGYDSYDVDDRSAIAMGRAESLEYETASLHPPSEDEVDDMPPLNLIHSQSSHNGTDEPSTPHPIFTHNYSDLQYHFHHDDGSSGSASLVEKRSTFGLRRNSIDTMPTDVSSTQADNDFVDRVVESSTLERSAVSPRPPSFGLLEFGKACIVDVQSSTRRSPTRNGLEAKVKVHHTGIQRLFSRRTPLKRSKSTSYLALTVPASGDEEMPTIALRSHEDLSVQGVPFPEAPVTTTRQASTSTLHSENSLRRGPSTYVDRGTDPGEYVEASGGSVRLRVDELNRKFSTCGVQKESQSRSSSLGKEFESLSDLKEDLVVHLNSGKPNTILESVIESYRKYNCGKAQAPATSLRVDQRTSDSLIAGHFKPSCNEEELKCEESSSDQPHQSSFIELRELWPTKECSRSQTNQPTSRPSVSPSQTTPSCSPIPHVYQSASANAIDVQDTLRAILKDNLGLETDHYKGNDQYSNLDWKPVFRTDDQIIAIGSEGVVSQEAFSDLTGQIALLGTKQSGMSRSATLDIGLAVLEPCTFSSKSGCELTTQQIPRRLCLAKLHQYKSPHNGLSNQQPFLLAFASSFAAHSASGNLFL